MNHIFSTSLNYKPIVFVMTNKVINIVIRFNLFLLVFCLAKTWKISKKLCSNVLNFKKLSFRKELSISSRVRK